MKEKGIHGEINVFHDDYWAYIYLAFRNDAQSKEGGCFGPPFVVQSVLLSDGSECLVLS